MEKARARWEKTLQWRRDNDVDAILHVSDKETYTSNRLL